MKDLCMDVVTVVRSVGVADGLFESVDHNEPKGGWRHLVVSGEGLSHPAAMNLGAFHPDASADVIGFLDPAARVRGQCIDTVLAMLQLERVVLVGCVYRSDPRSLRIWGLQSLVDSAVCFVRRDWFTEVGGFDASFQSHEEVDLARRCQETGNLCRPLGLPIHYTPVAPSSETFIQGAKRYREKWS